MRKLVAVLIGMFFSSGVALLYAGHPRLAWVVSPLVVAATCVPLLGYGLGLLPGSAFLWVTLLWMLACSLVTPILVATLPTTEGLPSQRWWNYLAVWAFSVVLGIAAEMGVREGCMEPYHIPAASMAPTLLVGDFILVRQGVCQAPVQAGDVIVFKYPPEPTIDYVKRVVATAGQTVEVYDGTVTVDGKTLSRLATTAPVVMDNECRPYAVTAYEETLGSHRYRTLADGMLGFADYGPEVVPANHLFVLGDNRDHSSDSRVWGFVPEENVKGIAGDVWMSMDRCPGYYRYRADRSGAIP